MYDFFVDYLLKIEIIVLNIYIGHNKNQIMLSSILSVKLVFFCKNIYSWKY